METREEDRISVLPDCLLVDILSRLPFTEDAIRTGTLSKRWKHLWTLVSSLNFTYSYYPQNPKARSDFSLLVDKTVTQCRQLKLKKFKVDMVYDIRFKPLYNKWIRYAISCNVEDLNLRFGYMTTGDKFLLHQSFFINSCFVDLRLANCLMKPTGAISWKNLRSLCLSGINLNEDLIENILSGSPLLETLIFDCRYLNDSDEPDTIKINASSNISKLTQCPQLKLKKFKVTTPYAIPFISQVNNWIHYVIRCNVEDLDLQFSNTKFESTFMLDQIVFTSSCFTHLTLGGCMRNPVGAISWKSLRSLCISWYRSLDEELIKKILCGSPVLETLCLDYCYGYRRLDISSKTVKNLVLSGYAGPNDRSEADIIEINAPNILSLTIKHEVYLQKLLLGDVSSLVKAKLDYIYLRPDTTPEGVEQEMLKELIQTLNLCHVKELEIGYYCSEVFSCLQAKGIDFPSNVKLAGRE